MWTMRERHKKRKVRGSGDDQLIRHSAFVAGVVVVAVVRVAVVAAGEYWVRCPVDAVDVVFVHFGVVLGPAALEFDLDPDDDDAVAAELVESSAVGARSLGGRVYSHSKKGRVARKLGTVLDVVEVHPEWLLGSIP